MKEQKRDKHEHVHDKEKPEAEEINKSVADEQKNAEDQIAELNDRYLRLAAEFDNYRRRSAKERLELVMTAGEDTIIGILPILDDMERALDVLRKADGDHLAAIEGTELIYKKLYAYLESKGLKVIESMGKELNTDMHEAIAQMPAAETAHKNKIIDVLQQGYTLNGKVIRFAKVVVGI